MVKKRPNLAVSAFTFAIVIWLGYSYFPRTETNPPVITQKEFDRIEVGMSYQEVSSIIGSDGTPYGSSGMPGEDGEEVEWLSYQWNNPDGSFADVSFFKNKVDTSRAKDLR